MFRLPHPGDIEGRLALAESRARFIASALDDLADRAGAAPSDATAIAGAAALLADLAHELGGINEALSDREDRQLAALHSVGGAALAHQIAHVAQSFETLDAAHRELAAGLIAEEAARQQPEGGVQ